MSETTSPLSLSIADHLPSADADRRRGGARAFLAAAGRIASWIAPGVTAAWAKRAFLTPRAGAPSANHRAVLGRSWRSRIRFGPRALAIYEWGGPGPLALLVHGWSGHAGQMTAFVDPLLARGFRVVAFDAPGHGASSRGLTHVPQIAEAIAHVARLQGGAQAVVAHSIGAVATAHAIGRGLKVDRLALVAPANGPRRWAERLSHALGLGGAASWRFVRAVEREAGIRLSEMELEELAPAVDCPALVIHDRDDKLAPPKDARRSAAALPSARVIETRGLGHFRILDSPSVAATVAEFVAG